MVPLCLFALFVVVRHDRMVWLGVVLLLLARGCRGRAAGGRGGAWWYHALLPSTNKEENIAMVVKNHQEVWC